MAECCCSRSRVYVSDMRRMLLTLAVLGVMFPWKCDAGLHQNVHSWAHLQPLNLKEGSYEKKHYQHVNTGKIAAGSYCHA